jgi:hypothetical protein
METKNAAHSGNDKPEPGLIRGATGSKRLSGEEAVAGSATVSEPVSNGTKDIVFLLKDGQVRHWDADMTGRLMSNYFFESFPDKISSIHFGESCYYVRNGKIGARVHMTREEFFEAVQP